MRAGKLDRKITIQWKSDNVSAAGNVASTWTDFDTVRAELVQPSVSETLTGYGEADMNNVVFRIRYKAGISTAFRILFDGKLFNIKEIVEIGRKRGLELRAVAVS